VFKFGGNRERPVGAIEGLAGGARNGCEVIGTYVHMTELLPLVGWFAIAAELQCRHIPTARGGRRWFPATVRSVLLTRQAELAAKTA